MDTFKVPLEDKTTDELVDLFNLLKGFHESTEEYLDYISSEEELRELLIYDIADDLLDKNYDGDNDYTVMYWYAKGLKNYEEAINDLMNIGYQDEIKHMKIPHVPKHMKPLQRYDLHKQFTDFNKSIVNKQLEANEFVSDLNPRELNRERLISFEEWKSYNNNDKQDELIEEIIERIELSPTNWEINFEKLNEYGRKKSTPFLIDSLENTVGRSLNASKKYDFRYTVITRNNKNDGEVRDYRTIPLKGNTFHDLIERLRSGGLSFDLDGEKSAVELFYSSNEVEMLQWSMFTSVSLSELKGATGKCYHDRGGKFFPYWNTTYIDLSEYQIFSPNDSFFERRQSVEVPCVLWALKGLISDVDLHKVQLRLMNENPRTRTQSIISNYHNSKDLDYLYNEFHIHCRLHYYDEYTTRPQFRIIERGVKEEDAEYNIELAIYREHYFKYKMTDYTRYFIKNYNDLKFVDDGNRVVGKRKSGTWQRDKRVTYYLNSLELVIEMMNNGMFSEMNYQDLYCLTIDIDDDTPICNIPLYFDDEDERDFRISSNQIQSQNEEHVMFMNEDELEDINTDSENFLSGTDSESD
ncbi:hypothetical protein M9Y10_044534 [Tritrichomonas musculus]|uniref:Uncharacterized protein n=1 Tax=Tritrichomonas musculus TaxID=1915356 RepID=A0ABR2JUH5_9EUKA